MAQNIIKNRTNNNRINQFEYNNHVINNSGCQQEI